MLMMNQSLPRCPNPACDKPHVIRNGSSGGRRRYECRGCGRFFGDTAGTPMYRLHTPAAEVAQALLIVMRRGSLRAAEEITGHKYETIGEWLRRASEHAEALTTVLTQDLHLSTVEIDEFWSFVRKKTGRLSKPMPANDGDASCKIAPAASSLPVLPDASATISSNKQ
jgi:transposase-like protein